MADGTDTPPISWLFERSERRRRAVQYWVRDIAKGLLITSVHVELKASPIDARSAFGALLAKNASRRYAELDARARENLKRIRPEQSDSASIDAAFLHVRVTAKRSQLFFGID